MTFRLLLEGMGVGVALAAPLGPINIEIIRRGLSGGFLFGWLVGLGAVSADTIYCIVIVAGLTSIADGPALRAPLFLVGAAVLGYLGLKSVRSAMVGLTSTGGLPSPRHSYATGFLMAAASPFGIVYWLSIGAALVASAVERAGSGATPTLVASVTFGIICWVTLLSILTRAGRRFVSPIAMRRVTALSGAALIGFGVYFGVQGIAALAAL